MLNHCERIIKKEKLLTVSTLAAVVELKEKDNNQQHSDANCKQKVLTSLCYAFAIY